MISIHGIQENFDAKHQIRRPEIGCKLNKLVTHYPFLPHCYFSKMNTYSQEANNYLDTFNALL